MEWSLSFTDSRLLSIGPVKPEARGQYADKWFEEADRKAVFERQNLLIEDLEVVSQATELAVQRG